MNFPILFQKKKSDLLKRRRKEHGRRSLRIEMLEDRRMLAGVTVITHGFTPSPSAIIDSFPDWPVTLGQAILDVADGAQTNKSTGSMYRSDPSSGIWQPINAGIWNNTNSINQEIVLLFDWSQESDRFKDGWLEAAADGLFSGLVKKNTNKRIAKYFPTLQIDHVTSLDPHPAQLMNDPGYNPSSPNDSFLRTYTNVAFADNYYRTDGIPIYDDVYENDLDFDGVVANGAYNVKLSETLLGLGGSLSEHSDVHSWYFGTVTSTLPTNYVGYSNASRNNDGDASFPDTWYGTDGNPARATGGFAYSQLRASNRSTSLHKV